MADPETNEPRRDMDAAAGTMSCPMCGSPGPAQGPTGMTRDMAPMMGMMSRMPVMCMAFMVVVPTLLGLGVGFVVGRGTRSR